jgi:hypothetical protein
MVDLRFEVSGPGLDNVEKRHFEAAAPPHDWRYWYAAYLSARQDGNSPDAAATAAGRYLAEVKHVAV